MWLTMWLALLLRCHDDDDGVDDVDVDVDDDVDDDGDDDDDDDDDRIEQSLGDRREAVGAVALASGRV